MKFCTVLGARPQFIKTASLSQELRQGHSEVLIHTGQHYDYEMSRVFFDELNIPVPNYNLETGSGAHGAQTGAMLASVEKVLEKEKPDVVVVIGDTNSTLAGALAAAKLNIPVAHVEAGLRSYRRTMPEEINRVLTDHLSTWLFCPTPASIANLQREGIERGVYLTGDVLDDALFQALPLARAANGVKQRLGIVGERYALATLHRAENTDDPDRLTAFALALPRLEMKVVFPVHPRTRAALKSVHLWDNLSSHSNICLTESVSYVDSLRLVDSAELVITDSGGLQREATALGIPCVVAREETEWVEALHEGRTILGGIDFSTLPDISSALLERVKGLPRPSLADRAGASRSIRQALEQSFGR